ncbi:conjugative transposon protein TraM [Aureibaculum sp. 2210JD6-5]|uniref:conjugative transposon protein TraM n=1 Tax=Aureibaculum sp. 2210JD6-5 TaxID=3103957 RepID=UPI002AADADB8|nr:conjugative transposon protein TraM [Aureibaculum sp. 2210JD6-5]MDY7395366.1 conjugative transposon protein TraM [Aureibaculum sp. 2210JD6-5]
MKVEKNKIVFSIVLACILLFIGGYAMLVMGKDEEPTIDNNQIPVPELEDNQKEYDSKLDALNDLKEVRETNAPSIYDERLLDSTGLYDPDLLDKKKMQMVDSIYQQGQIRYSDRTFENINPRYKPSKPTSKKEKDTTDAIVEKEMLVEAKELGLEHQLFFASHPIENDDLNSKNTDAFIYVRVDGTQTVKTNYRLQMRLIKGATIYGQRYSKNTPIYGFVNFKPNRTIINIENINHQPVKLKAFDLQDGSEGIYVENSFRSEVTNEVIGDMVDDINITGVPQVSGIRKIFQRNHKKVKVTVTDNYKLILKTSKPSLQQLFGKPKSH